MAPFLGGCSSVPSPINPVSWWHDLQGGEIAKQRPPAPGATEPYPNLASVPAKPQAPDQKALNAITQGLVADRAHADYMAAAAPIADPSSPTASPALFGQGTLPPPPPASAMGGPAAAGGAPGSAAGGLAPVASASLPAASAPPMPSGPPPAPLPAPRHPVQSTPLAPLAAGATPPSGATPVGTAEAGAGAPPMPPDNAAPATPPGTGPHVAQNAPLAPPGAAVIPPPASAPMPAIPTTPPAPPRMSGPGAPAMVVASASPPTAPAPRAGNAATVEFLPGSAALPPGVADVLKGIAATRGKAVVAVTGYGDATSDDPDVQSAALSLGLLRAQAVANVLAADGVPAAAVRVAAEAAGRGASVRLVQ